MILLIIFAKIGCATPVTAVNAQNVTTEDILSPAFPDPNTTEFGDQFTGPSGTTYVFNSTGDNINLKLTTGGYLTVPVGIWVVVDEDDEIVYPTPITAVNAQNVTTEDILSPAFPDPNTTEFGDQFTGPSGTTYVFNSTGDNVNLETTGGYVNVPVGEWVPVDED